MEKVKRKRLGRRILGVVLSVALVLGLMPGNVMTVRAEESSSTELSVTAFATPEQLMSSDNFALHTDTGSGVAQKVYFGTNGSNKQTWYIAGSDAADSIVLLCNPSLPMATGTMFEDDWENNKTYSADWRCTYETAPNEVYPNHYGASDLRGVLQEYTSNDNTEKFSAAEKELMQSTKVYTDDDKRKDEGETDYTYYTEDVLYPAYGDYNDGKFITVGANSAESLNGGLKVSLTSAPYNRGYIFWLRAPGYYFSYEALVANPSYVGNKYVYLGCSVVPAFRLNLSSVLFASAATAATSGASLTGTMTFRVDGDDKITSQASYSTDNVIVDAAEEETVYLYVQGKDGTTDWVYSQEVSADTTIATGTIKSGAKDSNGSAVSLTSVDLSQCEVWIEKKVTDDNLVYAVMAKEIETIATVAVTDITAPVAGAELDVAATCNTTGVSTTTLTVSYTKNGESVSGNAAGYLAGYTATVELEAAGDYTFTDETTATINGEAASVSYDADTGKLTVSYTFKTAKLPLGNAYYVTKDELMSSFDLDGTDDTVGKVYFGTNGSNKQTWYIAGSDAADSIVLLCDPSLPMATGTMFENDWQNNKTYSADWRCTYGTSPSEVYQNHYGASDLRGVLQEYTSNDNTEKFSAAEKELMQSTKVYTDDDKRKDESETDYTYYTEDVLYPAYGVYKDVQYITVGANSAESLNGGLKVSLQSAPYNGGDSFWLRAPRFSDGERALVATPGFFVTSRIVNSDCSVVPAFRLNLSSVLFASAATAATSDASLTDTLTFRVDDTEKIKSKAAYATCGVTVNYDEGDGNVFLYVQDADSVYSVEITEDTIVALSDMTGINNLTDESTKIWLEKSEDNVAYAVMAEALLTEHIDSNDDGICDHCDSYVEPKQEDEYYQIANANNLMWFAQKVNEGRTTINAKLTADIDMKDIDWTIMSSFAGTFDGNGYTISGLNGHIDIWAQKQCHGFIRTLDNGGFVKNLTFTGAKVFNHEGVGAISAIIVYTNHGVVENCVVKDSNIHHGDYDTIGVVVGANRGTIRNCASISNTMVRRFSSAKAICGFVWTNSGSIENCFNYDCTYQNGSNRYAFTQSNTGTITNCYYYESSETISDTVVTAKTADQFAGGEVAYLLNGEKTDGTQSWYQTLKTDIYPVPDNSHDTVYSIFACDGTTPAGYSNENKNEPHKDDNTDGKCDVCEASINGVILKGSNLTLNGNIGLNFFFDIDEEVRTEILADETALVRFTLADGSVVEIPAGEALEDNTSGTTLYKYPCELTSKQMADTVTVQFVVGNEVLVEKNHSVAAYAKMLITSGEYSEEAIALVKAMLNYGAKAQVNFGYNTENLANSITDAEGNPLISEAEKDVSAVTKDVFEPNKVSAKTVEGLGTFSSANLLLKSETTLNVYFKPEAGITADMLTFKVGDETVEATEVGQYFMVSVANIAADKLDDTFEITVTSKTDNTKTGTFAVSVYSYCYSVLTSNAQTDALKDTLRALHLYNVATQSYIDSLN